MIKPLERVERTGLAALQSLLQLLNIEAIRYCQWKSNIRLEEALCGGTDLDLLVDPRDMPAFQQIMRDQQVKLFHAAPGKEYPSISNYLGFDPQSGLLYHLHVHEALVLGEQFVKNYHLPVEADFLNETILQHGVKTPRPEVELIVFVVRALLKYRDRDGLKEIARAVLRRAKATAGFPQNVIHEARWLLAKTSLQAVQAQLQQWAGIVPGDVVLEFLAALQNGKLTGVRVLLLRERLRKSLAAHQRASRGLVMLRYFREDWRRKRKIFKRQDKKRMTRLQGGMQVAIIGQDGAGKSTIIQAVEDWLSWRISVRRFYMGKSKSFAVTRFIKNAEDLSRRGASGCRRLFGRGSLAARLSERNRRFWEIASFLAEGWERAHSYRISLQERDAGCVVIYDRFPLPNFTVFNRPLDGPRIKAELNGSASWLERKLSILEENMYGQIVNPEIFIALTLPPTVSYSRKPDHDLENITEKARVLNDAIAVLPGVKVVQADAPVERVIQQVKTIVWESL